MTFLHAIADIAQCHDITAKTIAQYEQQSSGPGPERNYEVDQIRTLKQIQSERLAAIAILETETKKGSN